MIKLYDYQLEAIEKMKDGCILCGGVGSGKSFTAVAYYYKEMGGVLNCDGYVEMRHPINLYIITTARKRDTFEWDKELSYFLLSRENNYYQNTVVVDSWNNIKKYVDVRDSFFIFDEQRVIGYGTWTKSFLKICRYNRWILLTATPGDSWSDYIPVFIANGYYRNKTEFSREHIVWNPRTNFPKIDRYLNTAKLLKIRREILVTMEYSRKTISHHMDIYSLYDRDEYKKAIKDRWNPFEGKPIENASEFCFVLRRIVNSNIHRTDDFMQILDEHPKVIVFYNFNYERDILLNLPYGIGFQVAEWNGFKHEPIPKSDKWVYLVQYAAGAEGWNCIETDTMIFYSQNYSYKTMIQAQGRIDRLNTPYTDLYYYHLKSRSGIDIAIGEALRQKKKFNEPVFAAQFKKGEVNGD